MAAAPVLGDRALNRALLARQGLLDPWDVPVGTALQRLIGLQSQAPQAAYTALWARLVHFDPAELSDLLERRTAVRIALLRGTIFLVIAEDAVALRPLLQPVLDRAIASTSGKATAHLSTREVTEAAGALMAERPRTFAELGGALRARWPDVDRAHLERRVRTDLPLVQVPPRGLWQRSGPSAHVTLDQWLGPRATTIGSATAAGDLGALLRRYLTAFKPASAADVQAWSGLTGVRAHLETLRPQLRTFRSERGQELFDVPEGLLPRADTPVAVRLLGEFDNILLAHADRNRIFDGAHRPRFMTQNGLIRATVLVDGFVAGVCRIDTTAGRPTLSVEPLTTIRGRDRSAIRAEGRRLLRFLHPERSGEVTID